MLKFLIKTMSLFCASTAAYAAGPGQIELRNSMAGDYDYTVNLGTNEINNVAGATVVKPFNMRATLGAFYCNRRGQRGWVRNYIWKAETKLSRSDINGGEGYLKVDDYIDAKIEVYLAGIGMVPIPFVDTNDSVYELHGCYYTNKGLPASVSTYGSEPDGSGLTLGYVHTGSRGQVTFKLRKPIINGVQMNGLRALELFGRWIPPGGSGGPYSAEPMLTLTFGTAVFNVPDKCVVNGNAPINVDFNIIPQKRYDGSDFVRSLPLTYQCSGGSFDKGARGIKLGLIGPPADFSSDYFATSSQNLGIVIKHKGKVVKPYEFVAMPATPTNSGRWDLTAAPISNTEDIGIGEFKASATVVMEFS